MASKRSRNAYFAVFERLSERVEQIGRKLAEFVQKQRAEIGHGDFARSRVRAASKQAGDARSRMDGDERAYVRKRVFARFTRDRPDFGQREDLRVRRGRKDPRESPAEKGFSRSRGAFEQNVVSSGSRDFEHPFRALLSGYFGEIGDVFYFRRRPVRNFGFPLFERGGASFPSVFEYFDRFGKAFCPECPDSGDSRGLTGVFDRQEDVGLAAFGERRRVRDDSSDLPQASVERKLAQNGDAFEFASGQSALFGDDSQGDGEIERRSRFSYFGGSEVHRDPFLGKGKSRVADGRTNPLAALLYCRVPESDDGERRKSRGDVDFNRNGVSRQPPNRRGKYVFNHKKSAEK